MSLVTRIERAVNERHDGALPGLTAGRLILLSQLLYITGIAPLIGMGVSARSHWGHWPLYFLLMVILLNTVAFGIATGGNRKRRGELAKGYTTIHADAIRDSRLFLLHYRTKAVVCGPGEPRPKRL